MHATVLIDGAEGEAAREIISRFMEFSLERDGDEVRLVSVFDVEGLNWRGRSGSIALEIVVPEGMELDIRDGSGSMRIVDTQADVRVEDGAGSSRCATSAASMCRTAQVRSVSGTLGATPASATARVA